MHNGKKIIPLINLPNIMFNFSFYIANKSVGAKGFKATWTEVKGPMEQCPPEMFQCKYSRFCISKQLTCNGMHNCGRDEHGNLDQSDEQSCKFESSFK